jgi:hypothetical protein
MVDVPIHMKGVDDGATSLMDRLTAKAREFRRENAGERALGGMLKGGIVSGGMDWAMDALGLGAAGVVADALSNSIKKAAEAAADFRRQLVMGKEDYDELHLKVAEGIPIYGKAVAAGQALREAILGAKLAQDLLNESYKIGSKYVEAQAARTEALSKINERAQGGIIDAKLESEIARAEDPIEKRLIGLRGAAQKRERSLRSTAAEDIETIKTKYNAEQQALQDRATNLRQQFYNDFNLPMESFEPGAMETPWHLPGPDPRKAFQTEKVKADIQSRIQEIKSVEAIVRAYPMLRDAAVGGRNQTLSNEIDASRTAHADKAEEVLRDRRNDQIKELESQEQRQREQAAEKLVQTKADTQNRLEKQRRDQLDAVEAIYDAESELRQKRLRMLGHDAEAEIEGLRRSYEQKIDAAKGGEREIAALRESFGLDVAAVERGRGFRFDGTSSSTPSRFMTGMGQSISRELSQQAATAELQRRAAKANISAEEILKKMDKTLKDIERKATPTVATRGSLGL